MGGPDAALLPAIGGLCLAAGLFSRPRPAVATDRSRGLPIRLIAMLGCVVGGVVAIVADPGVLTTTPVALALGLGLLNAGLAAARLAAERGWIAAPESPAIPRRVLVVRVRPARA